MGFLRQFQIKERYQVMVNINYSSLIINIFATLSLVISLSCTKGHFNSEEGKAIQQDIMKEYLSNPNVKVEFDELFLGENYSRISVAEYDYIKIEKVMSEVSSEIYFEFNAEDLLKKDFLNTIIDSVKRKNVDAIERYNASIDISKTLNYNGNDIRWWRHGYKSDIESTEKLYNVLEPIMERYIEFSGLDPQGIGVKDCYVKYSIKSVNSDVKVDYYFKYQIFIPSMNIASKSEITKDDFDNSKSKYISE